MTEGSSVVDPRVNITHQIKAGQVYTDCRSDEELHLVFLDDDHVLLKDEEKHARLMTRRDFEIGAGAGRFKVVGNVEVVAETAYSTIDFTKVDGVGNGTARNLQAAGYTTAEDIHRADRDDLLAVRGVGEGNLENIERFIEHMEGQVSF